MFYLFLILLISCSDEAASIVAEETNAGVSLCCRNHIFLRLQMLFHGTPPLCAVSYNALTGHSVHVDSFHIWHAYIFLMKSYYSKSRRLYLCMMIYSLLAVSVEHALFKNGNNVQKWER